MGFSCRRMWSSDTWSNVLKNTLNLNGGWKENFLTGYKRCTIQNYMNFLILNYNVKTLLNVPNKVITCSSWLTRTWSLQNSAATLQKVKKKKNTIYTGNADVRYFFYIFLISYFCYFLWYIKKKVMSYTINL